LKSLQCSTDYCAHYQWVAVVALHRNDPPRGINTWLECTKVVVQSPLSFNCRTMTNRRIDMSVWEFWGIQHFCTKNQIQDQNPKSRIVGQAIPWCTLYNQFNSTFQKSNLSHLSLFSTFRISNCNKISALYVQIRTHTSSRVKKNISICSQDIANIQRERRGGGLQKGQSSIHQFAQKDHSRQLMRI